VNPLPFATRDGCHIEQTLCAGLHHNYDIPLQRAHEPRLPRSPRRQKKPSLCRQVLLPPNARGTISYIAPAGHYTVNDEVRGKCSLSERCPRWTSARVLGLAAAAPMLAANITHDCEHMPHQCPEDVHMTSSPQPYTA
jgi:hypothetical protein